MKMLKTKFVFVLLIVMSVLFTFVSAIPMNILADGEPDGDYVRIGEDFYTVTDTASLIKADFES